MKIGIAVLCSSTFALLAAGAPLPAAAQKPAAKAPARQRIVRVADMFGTVEKRSDNGSYTPMATGQIVNKTITIRTGENSAVLLELPANTYLNHHSYVRIGAKSVVQFGEKKPGRMIDCKVLSGQAWGVVHPSSVSALFSISTPSTFTSPTGAVWGIGYDLESDTSTVSVASGNVLARAPSDVWRANVAAGQSIRFVRRPQPNVRLRAPKPAPQSPEEKSMWTLLRAENWIPINPRPNVKTPLKRGNESKLRALVGSPQIIEGRP